MDITSIATIGVVISLGVGGLVALSYYRKRNITKLFEQVYETSKQIPKKKKNSYLLLMFKETMTASKKKSKAASNASKLNNPKYVEIQLIQMSKILKNTSDIQDKTMKRALQLFNSYQVWEKEKHEKAKKAAQEKAA